METILHCFGESGHSYKVALMLEGCGIDWRVAKVEFFAGAARGTAFRALNPMAEAPVLEWRGEILTQSGAILTRLARETGRFGGADPDEALRWILFDNHKLSGQIGTLRFLMNFLAPEKRDPAVIAFMAGRCRAALATLEARLTGRDWIAGDGPGIADFSCCSYLYYPEDFQFDRGALPAIDAWLDRLQALPFWRHPYDLMPRAFPAPGAPT